VKYLSMVTLLHEPESGISTNLMLFNFVFESRSVLTKIHLKYLESRLKCYVAVVSLGEFKSPMVTVPRSTSHS
jgi:hypothetical protein